MKKLYLLFALPLILVSCTNKNQQRKVSKAEFIESWKAQQSNRTPRFAVGHYSYSYDSYNMVVLGSTDEHEKEDDTVRYTFANDGTFTYDHAPQYSDYSKPFYFSAESIIETEDTYDQYGGCMIFEFYVNPLTIVMSIVLTDSNESNFGVIVEKNEVRFDKYLWACYNKVSYYSRAYVGSSMAKAITIYTSTIDYTY